MNLWNKRYPDDPIDDDSELWELRDDTDIDGYDNDNCCSFNYDTSNTYQELYDKLGPFGTDINNDDHTQSWSTNWVLFAPKEQSYFDAPYKNIDDMIQDFISQNTILKDTNPDFIRKHLAYVRLVSIS